MGITLSSRAQDLFTRRGNTRLLWRSTSHSALDVANVSWSATGVTDLTPRLFDIAGIEPIDSEQRIANLGSAFGQHIIQSRIETPIDFRFYSSKDLTDEVQLLFADTRSSISGWLYFLYDVPFATASDSEGSRCDYAPVFTLGAKKEMSAGNTAASYGVRVVPTAAWVRDELVLP